MRQLGWAFLFLAKCGRAQEAGDFKLLSRRAVDPLLAFGEHDLYVRGLVTWP